MFVSGEVQLEIGFTDARARLATLMRAGWLLSASLQAYGAGPDGWPRSGALRLNLAVGREAFQRLLGFPPAGFANNAVEFDFTEPDHSRAMVSMRCGLFLPVFDELAEPPVVAGLSVCGGRSAA